jgi:hypothetical protein
MIRAEATIAVEIRRVRVGHGFVLFLRHLEDADVKRLAEYHLVLLFVGAAAPLGRWRTHEELAGRDENELHADAIRHHVEGFRIGRRGCGSGTRSWCALRFRGFGGQHLGISCWHRG